MVFWRSSLGLLAALWSSLSVSACRQSLLGTGNGQEQNTYSDLESSTGAQEAFVSAQASFINAVVGVNSNTGNGLFSNGGLLSDELTALESDGNGAALDGRYAVYNEIVGGQELEAEQPTDREFQALLYTRSKLLLPVGPLVTYEQSAGLQALAGEAYALAGYTEIYMAEDYCPGVTLDQALPGSGVQFGTPLSTDSLLGEAIGHFDSALAYAYHNDTVIYLTDVGLGRAWLDRDSLSEAARAVRNVPSAFVYYLTSAAASGNGGGLSPNFWARQGDYVAGFFGYGGGAENWNVADRDGGVGQNYISAHDARLALDSSGITADEYNVNGDNIHFPDSVFYYPLKFGPLGQSASIPMATGVEAALIAAEAADSVGGSAGANAMLRQLQVLRNNAAETYLQVATTLPTMTPDSMNFTGAEAISVLFRERAFWLFGLGTRLGDMRREVRQYGQQYFGGTQSAINAIYPNGPYAQYAVDSALGALGFSGLMISTYGSDIDFPLPTEVSTGATITNPYYKGCTSPTTAP